MRPNALYPIEQIDFNNVLFDHAEVLAINPQRFEMEQLDAVLHVEPDKHLIVGYKEIKPTEFWVRGHMPDFPLMPGVMLCECAAQLAAFYSRKYAILGGDFLGFGGIDEVRFRAPVFVGDRLLIIAQGTRIRPRRSEFSFQGWVGDKLIFSGVMIGVPIHKDRTSELGE